MNRKDNSKFIAVYLNKDTVKDFEKIIKKKDTNKSRILRKLIKFYIRKNKNLLEDK